MATPGVAGGYALQGHPAAFKGAMLPDGLHAIGAAARVVAALSSQEGGYGRLVKADERDE